MSEAAPVIWGCPVVWGARRGGVTCCWGCICRRGSLVPRSADLMQLHTSFVPKVSPFSPEVLAKVLGRWLLLEGVL